MTKLDKTETIPARTGLIWAELDETVKKLYRTGQNWDGQNWTDLDRTGLKLPQIGLKWTKLYKTVQNWTIMAEFSKTAHN